MSSKPPPAVPNSLPIADALRRSAPIAQLRERLDDSNRRFAAVRPHLPPAMSAHVEAGPVDAEGWTLLAANASVAAKLRQLEPRLQNALRLGGWAVSPIRIKIRSR